MGPADNVDFMIKLFFVSELDYEQRGGRSEKILFVPVVCNCCVKLISDAHMSTFRWPSKTTYFVA